MICDSTTSSFSERSGILTRDEILAYGLIADKLDERQLNTTTYDLRLGDRHLIYDQKTKAWICIFIGDNYDYNQAKLVGSTPVTQAKCLRLQPFESAIIQLLETVDTHSCLMCTQVYPAIICGRFDLKLKVIMKNVVSQQATQVEPGYVGKLFCLITNQSESEVIFEYEQSMATIEFTYASSLTKRQHDNILVEIDKINVDKYSNKAGIKRFCDERGLADVRYFLEDKGFIISGGGMINNLVTQQKMHEFVDSKVDKMVDDKLKWYKDSTDQSIRTIQWLIAAGVALCIFLANQFVNKLPTKSETTGQSINVNASSGLSPNNSFPLKLSGSYNPTKKIETSVGLSGSIGKNTNAQNTPFSCNTTVPSSKSLSIQVNCK